MTNELVTIATFANSIDAALAQHQLKAEGISAFLKDEATANIAWHLTVAIGGIKLQVLQQDAERAIDILTATSPVSQHTNDNLAQDILEVPLQQEDELERLSPADEILERAFRAAVFGLIFLPLQLYSLWLLLRLVFSGWKISSNRRLKALVTILLDTLLILLIYVVLTI